MDLPKAALMIYKGFVFSDSCPGHIGYGYVIIAIISMSNKLYETRDSDSSRLEITSREPFGKSHIAK